MAKNRRITSFLLISIAVAFCLSPFASSWPDGLESVAEKLGFLSLGETLPSFWSLAPMPDYKIPFINAETFSTMVAGAIGTLLTFGTTLLWWKIVQVKRK